MITFLPYPEYDASARSLDRQRLGKQRVEGLQILRALLGETRGWLGHPAVRMWIGNEEHLRQYTHEVCAEWRRRGYIDNVADALDRMTIVSPRTEPPSWLGDERLHRSHRARLVSKFPEHYVPQFGSLRDEPYFWPV